MNSRSKSFRQSALRRSNSRRPFASRCLRFKAQWGSPNRSFLLEDPRKQRMITRGTPILGNLQMILNVLQNDKDPEVKLHIYIYTYSIRVSIYIYIQCVCMYIYMIYMYSGSVLCSHSVVSCAHFSLLLLLVERNTLPHGLQINAMSLYHVKI